MHLYHQRFGSKGPFVIILHGLFGSGDNWRSIAKKLEAHFQLFLLDIRNHGQSFHHDDMNFELMAEDVVEFMRNINIDEAIIVGHSLGGKIAITLARDYPQFVTKLIVVDIGIKASIPRHEHFIEAMELINFDNVSSRNHIDTQLKTSIPEKRIRGFLMKNCIKDVSDQWKWRLNLQAIKTHYADLLEEIRLLRPLKVETHFIRGLDSDYISENDIVRLRQHFRNSYFHDIPHAGHWPHVDRPKTLIEILYRIL